MSRDLLSNPRHRALVLSAFFVVASVTAGYGAYMGKLKILGLLGLFTGGFLLRLASVRNAYWLTITCIQLSHVLYGPIHEEFEIDKWIALAGMAVLSIAVAAWHMFDVPPRPQLMHAFPFALLLLAAASTEWSVEPQTSFLKAGAMTLAVVVAFVGVYSHALTKESARSFADVHVDMLWMVFPLSAFLYFVPIAGSHDEGRYSSIFENANNLGAWFSAALPLLVASVLDHPIRWRRHAAAVVLGTALFVEFVCGSRGGLLGAAAGVGFYSLLRWPRRTLAFMAGLAVFTAFVVAYARSYDLSLAGISSTLDNLMRLDTLGTLSDRTVYWEIGLLIARQHPWLGHGFGTGESLFPRYGIDKLVGHGGPTVHNTYLDTFMTLGGVGVALLVLTVLWCVLLAWRTWRRAPRTEEGLLAIALGGCVIATALHSIVEGLIFGPGNPWGMPFWVNMALVARLWVLARERARAAPAVAQSAQPALAA
jgi:O-antigen ligase